MKITSHIMHHLRIYLQANSILLLFFSLISSHISLSAQTLNSPDREQQIKIAKNDTAKLLLLNKAAKELIRSDINLSKKYASDAIVIASKQNDKDNLALGLSILGQVEFSKGNYPLALDYLLKANMLYQEISNKKGMGEVCNLLGKVHHFHSPDNFYAAENYIRSAISIQLSINDKNGLAYSYVNLGDLYSDIINFKYFKPDTALVYYNKALKLANQTGDNYLLTLIYGAFGKTYNAMGAHTLAFSWLFKALDLQQKIGDKTGIIFTTYRLASVYNKTGNSSKAIEYNLVALKAAEETRNLDLINNICEDLSEMYASRNEFRKALNYYKRSVETKFQLYTQERIAKIAEYQTKYETVKKEKEIILLNKDKEIQQVELQKKEAEIKKRQITQNAFILGFILVLILAIVAYRGYQNKKTANLLLAKQKSEILEKNATLYQQKEEITSHRDEIEKKNTILKQAYSTIENKTNKITSSISYALKIQQSILPTEESRRKLLPESFVLFIPKDIVSGDFYWLDKRDNKIFLAAVDCTGHGVPGAFMSMIAFNLLDQALNVHYITKPSEILNFLNTKLREKLHTGIDDESLRDGMDIALCALQTDSMEIEYSGVHHPLYLIRKNKLLTFKPDNFNIGNNFNSDFPTFTNQIIKLEKDDAIYLFTDGYYDQFNSLNNKKFTRKRFNETLLQVAREPMDVQHKNLLSIFENWKGNNEQIDDILVMGIRI